MSHMGCNDPEHKEHFLSWIKERIEKAEQSTEDPPSELKSAYFSGNPKELGPEVWREWYDHMNPDWKEAAESVGGFAVPFSSEPQHREKFLVWLKARVELLDYEPETAPDGMKEALISGNPEDLQPEVRFSWEDHFYGRDKPDRPVDYGDPTTQMQAHRGPRGGRYTEARTKEGRPYRRYF